MAKEILLRVNSEAVFHLIMAIDHRLAEVQDVLDFVRPSCKQQFEDVKTNLEDVLKTLHRIYAELED